MKTKFNQLVFAGLGGLLQMGLLVSCTNDAQESNNLASSGKDVAVPISNNLTAVTCSQVVNTWSGFGGTGADYNLGVDDMIDDRSCTYNYAQGTYGSSYDWGVYRLLSSDDLGDHQTRIERASDVVRNVKAGNYVKITGYCRILETGSTDNSKVKTAVNDQNGSYFIQAKGTHTNIPVGADVDPAVALFLAKPVRGSDGNIVLNAQGKTDSFDIYREEITVRGGSGTTGRKLVFITNVKYNTDFYVEVSTGFKTVSGVVKQYVDSNVNNVISSFIAPQSTTNTPLQAKLRMGAYRCHGGSATILWRKGTAQSNFVNNP